MIDKKVVEYVADLARIAISEEEKELFGIQLSKIIHYIDKLKELDTEAVDPSSGVHFQENIFREDVASFSNLREEILKNAPSREGDYFKIPKVIE